MLQLVEHSFPQQTPYDIRLRSLAKEGLLKVYSCFPFFSTLSPAANLSSLAGDFHPVLPLLEYRRSFYVDADLKEIAEGFASAAPKEQDQQIGIYLDLMRSLIDPSHFPF